MEIRFRFAHVIYGYRIALKLRSQTEFSQCTKYVHRVSLYTVFVEHLTFDSDTAFDIFSQMTAVGVYQAAGMSRPSSINKAHLSPHSRTNQLMEWLVNLLHIHYLYQG